MRSQKVIFLWFLELLAQRVEYGAQGVPKGCPKVGKWCPRRSKMVPEGIKKLNLEDLDMHFLGVETYADCLLRLPLLLPVPGEGGENLRWFPPIPSQAKSMLHEIPLPTKKSPPF